MCLSSWTEMLMKKILQWKSNFIGVEWNPSIIHVIVPLSLYIIMHNDKIGHKSHTASLSNIWIFNTSVLICRMCRMKKAFKDDSRIFQFNFIYIVSNHNRRYFRTLYRCLYVLLMAKCPVFLLLLFYCTNCHAIASL